MKKLMLITALSMTVPFAYAVQPATSAPETVSVSFSQIDIDHDGMITKQEASSFSAVEVVFDDVDANRDGALDPDEFYGPQQ